MKKIALAKREAQESKQSEELGALEILAGGKLNKRTVIQLARKVDLKKVGAVAGGAAVVLSVASLTGKYGFYKGIVSGELKHQLAPVNKKLDELKAQNAELKAEIERLQAQQQPAEAAEKDEEEELRTKKSQPLGWDFFFSYSIPVSQAARRLLRCAQARTAPSTAARL